MKKIIGSVFIFVLCLAPINSFSQLDFSSLTAKEIKKISKKLDLKVINRGFNGVGKIYPSGSSLTYELWQEAMFEVNAPIGTKSGEEDGITIVDGTWVLNLDSGGYSGNITKLQSGENPVVLTFSTKEKMYVYRKNTSRSEEFKLWVKVILMKIYESI